VSTQKNLEVDAAAVAEFLRQNPKFLLQRPDLLRAMDIPHDSDGAVSLVERQVKSLREQIRQLQGQLIEVLHNAQHNEFLLGQCTRLITRLVCCRDLRHLADELAAACPPLFELTAVRFYCDELPGHEGAAELCHQLQLRFPDNQPVCGRCDEDTARLVFREESIRSLALIPLGPQAESGLLVFGHENPAAFDPNTGTLFLDTIGALVTALMERLAFANG
jgi:hypothetical protein